jgi:hypothetical protein
MLVTSVEGQPAASILQMAQVLYGKARGEKVRLELIVPRQRGLFVQYLQASAELIVR